MSKIGFGLWLNMRPSARDVLPPPLPDDLPDATLEGRGLLLLASLLNMGDPGTLVDAVGLRAWLFAFDFRLCIAQ